jgi:hypothetical protein
MMSKWTWTPATAGLLDANHLPTVFLPTIQPSRAPLMECDYNMHKSNSTYFSDLDTTRSYLVCCLVHTGIQKLQKNPGLVILPDGTPAKGRWLIMLGGVACSFKREIGIYEGYEMWSRLLCWDRKWFYVVTHFVKKGTVKPDGWIVDDPNESSFLPKFLQKSKEVPKCAKIAEVLDENGNIPLMPKVPSSAIFASAISKYVMKLGRFTIHPEVALDLSGLLPPKPGGWNIMDGKIRSPSSSTTVSPGASSPSQTTSASASPQGLSGLSHVFVNSRAIETAAETILAETGAPNGSAVPNEKESATAGWDWKMIEAENARGLEYAKHFAALDNLDQTFTGEEQPALGVYGLGL